MARRTSVLSKDARSTAARGRLVTGIAVLAVLGMATVAVGAPVTGLAPATGPATGGTVVDVSGSGFSTAGGATRIFFGGRSASAVTCFSVVLCRATAPAGSGAVQVSATVNGRTAAGDATATYRYAPAITKLSPASGSMTGGSTVKVDGQGFVPGATSFTLGALVAAGNCTSTTSCQITTPGVATPATVDLTATATVAGTVLSSNPTAATRFTFTVPPGTPNITAVTPAGGPATVGTPFTITGTGFSVTSGATSIRFGASYATGTPATNVVCSTTTICSGTTPPGNGTVDVFARVGTVTSFAGAGTRFTYIARPTITSLAPSSGPQAGGAVVTVTGTGFDVGTVSFRFGPSAPIVAACASAVSCTVTAPPSPTFGLVDVVATVGGQSSLPAVYEYLEPPNPVITSVSPSRGSASGGTLVTIDGAKLMGGTVAFGGTLAPGAVCTAIRCTVTAPPHGVGRADITVTTGGGTNFDTAADDFTFAAPLTTPPVAPHAITSFTQRDFVSVEGFPTSEAPYTIQVVRGGTVVASATNLTPDADGIMEVNHPGGACWVGPPGGMTPDIQPGDRIRVVGSTGIAEETTTVAVAVNPTIVVAPIAGAPPGSVTLTVRGTARDAAGNALPLDQIEHRFVVLDPKAKFNASARRTLRAFDGGVAPDDGTMVIDGSGNWTVTYTLRVGAVTTDGVTLTQPLVQQDVALALSGSESRAMWLGADPAAGVEATIFEYGPDVFGGPQAPCTAPWEPDTQAPTSPSPVTASVDADPNGDGVSVTWGASTDNREVTGYRIVRHAASDGSDTTIDVPATQLSYHDLHRAVDTYTYSVRALDAAGNISPAAAAPPVLTRAADVPDLRIVKTHAGDAFVEGSTGQYELTVTNIGTWPASGTVTVTDTLPAGLSIASINSNPGVGPDMDCTASTASNVSCTGNIGWSAGAEKRIDVTVNVTHIAAGELANTATVDFSPGIGQPDDTVADNDTSTDVVLVDLAVPAPMDRHNPPNGGHALIAFPGRDFVSAEGYTPGDLVTVQVVRGGSIIAESRLFTVDDAGIPEINHPGGGCWSADPLHPIANPAATYAFTPNIQPGDVVRYISKLEGSAQEITVANVKVSRPYVAAPGVIRMHGIAQDASGNPLPVDQVEARLVAGSRAGGELFNIPGGAKRDIRASAGGGEGTLSYDAPGSVSWTAEWHLDQHDSDLALISEARAVSLGADPLLGNDLTIFEVGDGALPVDKGPQAPCTAPLDATPTPPAPDLGITSSHSDPFTVGTDAQYQLAITNHGTGAATAQVVVRDNLPDGITLVGAGTSTPGWTCSASGHHVTCTSESDIAVGATTTLALDVAVANAAVPSVSNEAFVETKLDSSALNNRATDTTNVNPLVIPTPDLSVSVSHTGRFTAGITDNSYLITVANGLGPAIVTPAGQVRVVDTLPAGMTYRPAGSGGVNWACAAAGQDVTCDYTGTLNDGDSATPLRIFATFGPAANPLAGPVPAADPVEVTLTNSATATDIGGGEPTSLLSDNTDTDPTVVRSNPSAPDGGLHMIVFPSRDFVSIDGFDMGPDLVDPNDGDGLVTVQVWRAGVLQSTSAPTAPIDDPETPEVDGIVEINHVGVNDCWIGNTPDIRPGDVIRTVDGRGVMYEQTVLDVRTLPAVQIAPDTVVFHGTAQDGSGNPLPLGQLEHRLVKPKAAPAFSNGKRTLRAPLDGTLTYDGPGAISWTATYSGLSATDVAAVLDAGPNGAESRIVSSPDLLAGNDLTIFENGPGTEGGPADPLTCPPPPAPEADLAVVVTPPAGPLATDSDQTATITVSNNGPNTANNAELTVALPVAAGGFDVVTDTGAVTTTGATSRIAIGNLASGATATITIAFHTPAAPTTLSLMAFARSDSADQHPVAGADNAGVRMTVS